MGFVDGIANMQRERRFERGGAVVRPVSGC